MLVATRLVARTDCEKQVNRWDKYPSWLSLHICLGILGKDSKPATMCGSFTPRPESLFLRGGNIDAILTKIKPNKPIKQHGVCHFVGCIDISTTFFSELYQCSHCDLFSGFPV